MGKGLLLVVSGPSGAGKSTVCQELLRRIPDARWSVSATTRPPRPGDVDGETYWFVSEEEFSRRREAGEFLECAQYLGHWYGTPIGPVREALARGEVLVLEIDVQGAAQVAERMPESLRVFLLPPSMEELRRRLVGRRTESAEQQAARLARAQEEIEAARRLGCYNAFVVNDDVGRAAEEIARLVEQKRSEG